MATTYLPDVFAANLRAERNRRDITQDELADRTGISRTTLANYESGNANPVLENLGKIAGALNCSVSTLIERVDRSGSNDD